MGWHTYGMGWGGWLYMLVVFGLIVIGGVAVVRWSMKSGSGEEPALEILKRRYVRGEITKEEFETMKKDIQ